LPETGSLTSSSKALALALDAVLAVFLGM
jgi:hypothetical protein